MLKRNLQLQEEVLLRYENLFKLGAASELQYLERLNQVAELDGKLSQVLVERLRQKASQDQQIQQLKSELEALQTQITEASVNLRYQVFVHETRSFSIYNQRKRVRSSLKQKLL